MVSDYALPGRETFRSEACGVESGERSPTALYKPSGAAPRTPSGSRPRNMRPSDEDEDDACSEYRSTVGEPFDLLALYPYGPAQSQ